MANMKLTRSLSRGRPVPSRCWRIVHGFLAVTMLLAAAGCGSATTSTSASTATPAFVDELIAGIKAEPVRNPPAKILRYQYDGREVYFVPSHCCDMTSELFTANGDRICAPDGGITGRGDGRCPDFHETRSDEELIWADDRAIDAK